MEVGDEEPTNKRNDACFICFASSDLPKPNSPFISHFEQNGDCTIADMTFTISSGGVKAEFSGNCTKDTIQIPGVDGTYEALQFHIHLSSEHTIDGEYFGAELHIVHKQTDGDRYAVVGMMLDAKNPENHGTFEYFVEGWTAISKQTAQTCITSSRLGGKRVRERDRRNLQQFDA